MISNTAAEGTTCAYGMVAAAAVQEPKIDNIAQVRYMIHTGNNIAEREGVEF